MLNNNLENIKLFLKNKLYWKVYWKSIATNLVGSFSVVFLIFNIAEYLLSIPQINNQFIIVTSILFALLYSLFVNIPVYVYSKLIMGSNTSIELKIGNIITEPGDLIVPTNSSFDTNWNFIKPTSIQGQVCKEFFNGRPCDIDALLNEVLENKAPAKIVNHPKGKNNQYTKDTIAKIKCNNKVFYWLPITDFNEDGNCIYNSIDLKYSIDSLWKYFKGDNIDINDLCIPVLGTGLTPINIPMVHIVEYIIDSFIVAQSQNERKIASKLKIILYEKDPDTYQNYKYLCNYLELRSSNGLLQIKYKK